MVGYTTNNRFIIRNSWGTGWGEGGYFCIGYGECGIDSSMYGVDAIVDTAWLNNISVRGLWNNKADRNAYAYLGNEGWKRITNSNDPNFFMMLNDLATAKSAGKNVTAHVENGIITEVYA